MVPFLLLLAQEPTPPVAPPQAPPALDLRTSPVIAEANRIALTPRIDGKIDEEEWDALGTTGDVRSFLQWEPGALHVAAMGAAGHDLLVSVDPGGDGWLVGANNLEARIGVRDGKPFLKIRLLDATNVSGPIYREIAGLEAASTVSVGPDGTIEASIVDPGLGLLPTKAGKLAARVDVVRGDEPSLPAYEPRMLAPMNLVLSRNAGLPAGLKATVDFNDIPVVPGDEIAIRFGFTGAPLPNRIGLRTEGLGREATSASEMPFPKPGRRSTNVDYRTRVLPETLVGYRIARATVTGADGVPGLVQASYRIALPADVTLRETHLKPSENDRSPKMGYSLVGNSRSRLSGQVRISVPPPYRVLNGEDAQRLRTFEPRLGVNYSFGLFVPAGSKGTVPVTFSLELNGKKFDVVRYVTID